MSRWINFLLCFVILDIGLCHILIKEPSEPSKEENEGPIKSPLRPSKMYSFLLTLQNMIEDLIPEPSNGNVIYVYRFKNYRFSNDVGENIRFWKKEFILWNKYNIQISNFCLKIKFFLSFFSNIFFQFINKFFFNFNF